MRESSSMSNHLIDHMSGGHRLEKVNRTCARQSRSPNPYRAGIQSFRRQRCLSQVDARWKAAAAARVNIDKGIT